MPYIHEYTHTYTFKGDQKEKVSVTSFNINIHCTYHTYMHTCIHAYIHTYTGDPREVLSTVASNIKVVDDYCT